MAAVGSGRPRGRVLAFIVITLVAGAVLATTVFASSGDSVGLMASASPNRSAASALSGQSISGKVAVFATATRAKSVKFWIDDPLRQGSPIRTETSNPYDMLGTSSNGEAVMLDTAQLPEGPHVVTIGVRDVKGALFVKSSQFVVVRGVAPLSPAPTTSTTQPPSTTAPSTTTTTKPPSTTAPSTTTTTVAPATAFVPAPTGWPNAANTGPSGTLTVVNGDLVLDQPGQVVTNVEVRGTIQVRASNVTVRNFKAKAISNVFWYGFKNATFEDGLVDGQNSEAACVLYGHYTLRRMELTRCGDGAKFGPASYIYDTWIHDLWVPPGAHSDGLQSTGNSSAPFDGPSVISHVWLDMPLMLGDEDSPLGSITITNSYLGGGLWGGWNQATGTYPSALSVTGNVIASPIVYVSPSTTWSGNTTLTGSAIPHP